MFAFLSSLFRRLCVLAVFSVSAVLHGASSGFPFVEDFQAEIFIDGSRTTARWTSEGVALKHAGNLHKNRLSMQEKSAGAAGTDAIEDIALQDINGDGHLDLIAAGAGGIAVYFMDPSSEALFVSSTVVTTVPRSSLTFGDYDEDGDLDIVAGSAEGNVTVMLYENTGGGAFAAGILLEPLLDTVLLVNALATAYIDGDDHLDVVLAINEESGDLEFYEGKGDGNFQFHEPIASGMAHRDLKIGDMDGDGHVDIVVGDVYHRNLMEWGFEEADLTIPGGSLALGDINNDGHLDIVRGVNRGRNRLHLNDGRGGFSTGTDIGVVRTTSDIAVGDMDGDGDLDLVEGVLSERRRRAFIHSNPGVEVSRWPVSNLFTADTRAVALGDVDGDGDLDIALGHRNDTLKIKINPGGSTATAPVANLFDTVPGWVVSSPIITGTAPSRAHLKAVEEKPVNTEIVYYLSNDGGNRWRQVKSPGHVDFAGMGSDLRWGARLTSLSPTTSPRIVQVDVEAGLQVYVDSTPHKSGQVWLAPDVEVGKPPFQASLLLKNRGKDALDIVGMELGSDMEGFSLPEHRPTASSPHTIASEGELGNLWIRFRPSNRETHSTVLTISSRENGEELPDFTLTLEGDGEAPVIDIGRITVPPTRTGREGHFTIGLRNTGEHFLVVTATRTSDVTPPSAATQSTAERPLFGPASPWQTTTFSESGLFQRFPFVFRPHHRGLSSATLTFSSNAFNEDENEVMLSGRGLAPVIAVDVDGAFGEVDVNSETTRAAVIRNTGDWPLMVTNIRFAATATGGFGFSPEETSFPVSQTEARELVLSFQPGEAGEVMNELLVISDAHNARSADRAFVIELSGEGVAPHIGVMVDGAPVGERRIYSFGKQRLNTSKSVSVSIDNTAGTALLRVDPVARSGGEHLPFAWTGSSAIDVVRGGSATSVLTVLFEPTERGFHSTTLAITSNALNSTRYELMLTGTGTAPLMEVLLGDARQPSGSTWSFGWVSPGTVATQAMTVHNAGDDTLQIKAHPSFGNDAFTAGDPGGYRYPNSVGAQSSESYVLLFNPPPSSPAGEVTTTMTVISDDFLQTTYTLVLSGIVDLEPVFQGPPVPAQNYDAGFPIVPLMLPRATDANGALTYNLAPGTLPAGLSLDRKTRVLSGTPTEVAMATTYTWTATDADGDIATLDFTITVQAGICNRTREVRDAIVEWVSGVTSCGGITATHLEEVEVLYLDNQDIAALKRGDFAGLVNLTELDLSSNLLESLDARLLAGLADLMDLNLRSNRLTSLDAELFAGLSGLERLNLRSNRLAALNAELFAGLSSLERLDLYANRLSELPQGIFDGLDVERLYLNRNPASPFVLNIYPELSGNGMRARIDEGAPREIRVMWSATGGSSGTGVATIPAGSRFSPVFVTPGRQATTITLTNPVFSSTRYLNGLQLAVPATASDARIPGVPTMEVMLGDAVQPSGSTHSFGQLSPGGIATQVMTIHNLGETALQIKTSPTTSGAFRVVNLNGYEYPHAVEAMSSASYVVSFEPPLSSPAGEVMTTMTIISNDFLQTTYTAVLSGIVDLAPVFEGPSVTTQNYEVGVPIVPLTLPEAASGNMPITYTLTPQTLPPGLSFATATRVLSGTPTTDAATVAYTWKATDADGDTATLNFTITVQSGICNRTQEVRDEIVRRTAGVTSCADITAAHLAGFGYLDIRLSRVSALKRGDFEGMSNMGTLNIYYNFLLSKLDKSLFFGLSNLRYLVMFGNRLSDLDKDLFAGLSNLNHLDLSGNRLSQLPEGLFDGLDRIFTLDLRRNPGSPFVLDVYPELSGNGVRARIDEGTPREIQVTWTVTGGSGGVGTATIPAGSRFSPVFATAVFATADRQRAATIALSDPRFRYSREINGLQLTVPAAKRSVRVSGTDPIAEVVLGDTPQPLGSTHSFGQLAPGRIATQAMTIHNIGDTTLQIKEEPSLGGAFRISNPNGYRYPHSVEALSSASYMVSFEPPQSSASGDLTAAMTVINNDPLQTTYTVALHGEVVDLQPVFEDSLATIQNYEVGVSNPLTLPEAASGNTPITYTLTPQTLPPGLSFATATRVLSGTPTTDAAMVAYTWKAADADGDTATLDFTITVRSGICNRTQQVRDKIVELTADVTSCADITATHLGEIGELRLNESNISALKRGDFAGLSNLNALHLYRNRLTKLDKTLFSGLSSLEWLHLGWNRLSEVDKTLFSGLSGLERLDLNSNHLSGVDKTLFAGLSNLEWLSLGHNHLTKLDKTLFSGLSSLEQLYLDNNRFSRLDKTLFSGLSNLERLHLGFNQLSEADKSLFSGLSNLQWLHLDNNRFSELDKTLFSSLGSLRELYLHSNRLSELAEGLFDGLNLTYGLRLYGNPGSPFVLDVYPELSGSGARVRIDEGAPREIRVNWTASGGSSETGVVTIPAGARVSNRIGTAGRQAITVALTNPGFRHTGGIYGLQLAVSATRSSIRIPGTDPIAEVVLGDTPQPLGSTHSFGQLSPGNVATQAMTIHNIGDVTLQINEEPSLGGAFRLSNPNRYRYPHSVEAMSSASYVVSFEPPLSSVSESLTTTMTIINNDPLQTTYTVVLHGEIVDLRPVFEGPPLAAQNYEVGVQISPLTLPKARSGNGEITYTLTPALPPGLSFNAATRALSGTPTAVASAAAYTLTATDADGDTATLNFTITVRSGICNRTRKVHEEIVELTPGVTNCADITATHLSGIDHLYLNWHGINTLKTGDFAGLTNLNHLALNGNRLTGINSGLFAGLTNLTRLALAFNNLTSLEPDTFAGLGNLVHLRLINNQLSALPPGIFDGLNLTTSLFLEGNPGAPFTLNIYPELSGNGVRARIDEAAPREIQVSWTATGGSNATGTATISAGTRFSPAFGAAGQQAVTITLSNPRFSNAGNITGVQLAVPTTANSATLPALPPTPQSSPSLKMSDPSRFPAPPPSPPPPQSPPPLKMSGG